MFCIYVISSIFLEIFKIAATANQHGQVNPVSVHCSWTFLLSFSPLTSNIWASGCSLPFKASTLFCIRYPDYSLGFVMTVRCFLRCAAEAVKQHIDHPPSQERRQWHVCMHCLQHPRLWSGPGLPQCRRWALALAQTGNDIRDKETISFNYPLTNACIASKVSMSLPILQWCLSA